MRIGLLGGSFDPPHNGHLLAARDAFEGLSLDRLLFIPTALQPLKLEQTAASAADRLAMVRLLVEGETGFEVSTAETDRGGLSYTVDTLAAFAEAWPAADRYWLIGADAAGTLAKWRSPERIAQLATIVVLQRAGDDPDLDLLPSGVTARLLATRRIDISSTEIRQRVRAGKSIRGLVPETVADFIAVKQLYR